jgi:hypothetical protein
MANDQQVELNGSIMMHYVCWQAATFDRILKQLEVLQGRMVQVEKKVNEIMVVERSGELVWQSKN